MLTQLLAWSQNINLQNFLCPLTESTALSSFKTKQKIWGAPPESFIYRSLISATSVWQEFSNKSKLQVENIFAKPASWKQNTGKIERFINLDPEACMLSFSTSWKLQNRGLFKYHHAAYYLSSPEHEENCMTLQEGTVIR